MSRTTSTEIFNIVSVEKLTIVETYKELMKASVGTGSIYLKAKETMEAFLSAGEMADSDKAMILSKMLGDMSTSITNQAMNTALVVAKEDREAPYTLAKLREETKLIKEQIDKVAADNVLTTAQASKVDQDKNLGIIQGWKLQSDMVRENGVTTFPSITTPQLPVGNVGARGMKWETEQQTKMSVYATLAKSYRESGVVTWTVDSGTNKINTITDLAPATPGLTKRQEEVAVRQEKGFDDNKRQHAANSSANMIGLLLSSEESSAITPADVAQWREAVGYLNTDNSGTPAPIAGVITTTSFIDGGAVSKAAGITISGTSTGFIPGTSINCVLSTGANTTYEESSTVSGLIQLENSNEWSITMNITDMDNLAITTAGTIRITAVDSGGIVRTDSSISTCTIGA